MPLTGNRRSTNKGRFNDPNFMSQFLSQLKTFVDNRIHKSRFVRSISGEVVTVGGTTANVYINGESTNAITLKFLSGLSLTGGDEVTILLLDGTVNNAIILDKK